MLSLVLVIAAVRFGGIAYQKFSEYTLDRQLLQQVERSAGQDEETNRKAVSDNLAKHSDQNKPKAAASQFFGWYFKNTRGYVAYCQKRWRLDVSAFGDAFAEAHQWEYDQAKALLNDAGFNEEKLWSVSQTAVRRAVEIEMSQADGTPVGSLDICRGLNGDPRAAASEMHFSKVNPEAHGLLRTAATR